MQKLQGNIGNEGGKQEDKAGEEQENEAGEQARWRIWNADYIDLLELLKQTVTNSVI